MRTIKLLSILALLGAAACSDVMESRVGEEPLFGVGAAAKTTISFEIGVLEWVAFDRMWFPDGRLHADGSLQGAVSGDLEGEAELFLRARLDDKNWAPDVKVGVANGTLLITTAEGIWEGALIGTFIGEQYFAKTVLHGPAGMKFSGQCDETSPASEILACSGELLSPKG